MLKKKEKNERKRKIFLGGKSHGILDFPKTVSKTSCSTCPFPKIQLFVYHYFSSISLTTSCQSLEKNLLHKSETFKIP